MFIRIALLASCCLVLSAPVEASPIPADADAGSAPIRCATPEPTPAETDALRALLRNPAGTLRRVAAGGTIKVAFHILTCKGEGDVPQSQIDDQITELNAAYSSTGFTFELASVDRTENCSWFGSATGYGVEKKMKQSLAIDPAHRLNVYSCKLKHNLLGWAYFPQSFAEDDPMHGVVMHYGSFPGAYLAPYNEGGTLDHEAGHYLGLFHTFEGGCVEPGDYIDDTPFEASPAFGCPVGRNTCDQPGDDPIHNYMDYTTDACYSEFTPDQAERMQVMVSAYRPSLLNAAVVFGGGAREAAPAPAGNAGVLALHGAAPNPFSGETMVRFSVLAGGNVSLALYNVAGQRVATLVDGPVSAGEQAVPLRAGTLAPGIYFVTLRAAGVNSTRSVVLAR